MFDDEGWSAVGEPPEDLPVCEAVVPADADTGDLYGGVGEEVWLARAVPPAEPEAPLTDADRLAGALAAGPGPVAAARLGGLDPRGLLAHDKVEACRAWEALIAWAQAGQARALAALDHRHPDDAPGLVLDPAVTDVEVRAALRLAPGVASDRLDLARDLDTRLGPTLTALSAGRISLAHAQVLRDGLAPVREPDLLAALQEQALAHAAVKTPAATRAAIARLVLDADPDAAAQRHEAARADRHVRVFPLPDGMACLSVQAPAEQIQAAWQALTAAAQAERTQDATGNGPPVDGYTIDACRADLALDLLRRADATLPAARRPRALITVPASTLLGGDQQPALLTGYGWITADAARRIAADATWTRLLTDPASGAVLDVGSTSYRPPADLVRHVTVRDQTCRAPHCPRPASQCDLDHIRPYNDGGPTSAANLHATCRHDHQAKTHGGWSITPHPDGSTTWSSARGITHHVPAPEPPPATIIQSQPGTGPEPESDLEQDPSF